MSAGAGVGHFVSWEGGCILLGESVGVIPMHAHYAIQITAGSEPGVRFSVREGDAWTSYAGAVLPSRQPHSRDGPSVREALAAHHHATSISMGPPQGPGT